MRCHNIPKLPAACLFNPTQMARFLPQLVTMSYASLIPEAVLQVSKSYDLRADQNINNLLSKGHPMTRSHNYELLWSVMFSPDQPNQVATAGSKGGTQLYDIRFSTR